MPKVVVVLDVLRWCTVEEVLVLHPHLTAIAQPRKVSIMYTTRCAGGSAGVVRVEAVLQLSIEKAAASAPTHLDAATSRHQRHCSPVSHFIVAVAIHASGGRSAGLVAPA